MVLTYDAYNETLENQKEKEDDLQILKQHMKTIISILGKVGTDSKQEIANLLIEQGMYKAGRN